MSRHFRSRALNTRSGCPSVFHVRVRVCVCVYFLTAHEATVAKTDVREVSFKAQNLPCFALWPRPGHLPSFDLSRFICKMRINKGTVSLFSVLGILFK